MASSSFFILSIVHIARATKTSLDILVMGDWGINNIYMDHKQSLSYKLNTQVDHQIVHTQPTMK